MIRVHPLAEVFPLIAGDDFEALARDVAAHGLREPIRLWQGLLLDGRNRYRALTQAGLVAADDDAAALVLAGFAVDCSAVPAHALAGMVLSLNLHRRHLTPSQKAVVAADLARIGHGGARRGVEFGAADQGANLPLEHQRIEDVANALQVSPRMVKEARGLMAEAPPEVIEDVRAGHIAVHDARATVRQVRHDLGARGEAVDADAVSIAYRRFRADEMARRVASKERKQQERAAREARLAGRIADANAALAVADKRYGVILADPEWDWETWGEGGKDRTPENHYPLSATATIAARPVERLAAADCVLFLWATAPRLPDALDVMRAWGFAYKTHAIWRKDKVGMGYWFRSVHEVLLVGTRGDVVAPAPGTQDISVFDAPTGAHSEKPVCVHAMIERLFPTMPKIELNARAARAGWDCWGAEAPEVAS